MLAVPTLRAAILSARSSLLRGLVSYWKMDETSGTRFDSAGSNHLTSNNSVGQAAGKIGNAASFVAASSQSLSVLTNSLRPGAQSVSVVSWFNPSSLGTSQHIAGIENTFGATACEYRLALQTTNKFGFEIANGAATAQTPAGTITAVTGTWYFVVGTWDAATGLLCCYTNAGTPATTTLTGSLPTTVNAFTIGARASNTLFANGSIDGVGVWIGRVLTLAEITALYNAGNGLDYPFTGT